MDAKPLRDEEKPFFAVVNFSEDTLSCLMRLSRSDVFYSKVPWSPLVTLVYKRICLLPNKLQAKSRGVCCNEFRISFCIPTCCDFPVWDLPLLFMVFPLRSNEDFMFTSTDCFKVKRM